MKMKNMKIITTMLIATISLLAEVGPTQTDDYQLTERGSTPTTCRLASRWSCRGDECPTCTYDTTGYRDIMRLNFPDNKITCIEGKIRVPDNADLTKLLTIRVTTARVGGQPGVSGGGTCSGACASLDFLITGIAEGEHLASYLWDPLLIYRSDLIPGGGPNNPGKQITAAIRDIPMFDNGLERRNLAGIRLCRDSRSFNPNDTQPGTEGLDSIYVVWPIDSYPVNP